MDILDRLLGHDTWTTRQLLLASQSLPDDLLDKEFDIDHKSLRETFIHVIENMEIWTDLLYERAVQDKTGNTIPELLERLSIVSRDFANLARNIVREERYDDCFIDTLDNPPMKKTFGGAIGHVITHNMHHRAQIMFLMEKAGLKNHIEGDLLSWESNSFGWR
ncbi:MAG: DinB family protein [Anaerolineae bacterium]|nr:DinB family protein [Anaerolineae bacterium]